MSMQTLVQKDTSRWYRISARCRTLQLFAITDWMIFWKPLELNPAMYVHIALMVRNKTSENVKQNFLSEKSRTMSIYQPLCRTVFVDNLSISL